MLIMKCFVLGAERIPDWFRVECLTGRAKLHYSEVDHNVLGATIYTPTKTFEAKLGDSIVYTELGLHVIPKDKAIKYKLQKPNKGNSDAKSNNKVY